MHGENRLPQGREHGAVTPRAKAARNLEPRTAGTPTWQPRDRRAGRIQMAAAAAKAWPRRTSLSGSGPRGYQMGYRGQSVAEDILSEG
jgi:hypothetical protein